MHRHLPSSITVALSAALVACSGSVDVTQAGATTSGAGGSGAAASTSSTTGSGGATSGTGAGGMAPPAGVVAQLDDQPTALAVIGSDVYVALFTQGIVAVPKAGGSVKQIVQPTTAGEHIQIPFVFDQTRLYFAESTGGATPSVIASAPIGGGPVKVLATPTGFISGIVVDSSWVYWVDQDQGSISQVPIAGGKPDGILVGLGSTPAGLALQDETLYFSDPAGDLWVTPTAGTPLAKNFTGPGVPPNTEYADYTRPLAVDAGNVYFSDCVQGKGTLYRFPHSASSPTPLASACPTGIAVDAKDVYWASGNTISAVPIAGGPTRVVTTSKQAVAAGPEVDDESVYWGVTPDVATCGVCPPPAAGQVNAILRAPKGAD